jgi:hypothetical protein
MIGEKAYQAFITAMNKIEEEGEHYLINMQQDQLKEIISRDHSVFNKEDHKRYQNMLTLWNSKEFDLLEMRVELRFFEQLLDII